MTRRTAIGGTALAVALAGAYPTMAQSPVADGPWSYTDAKGVTVELPQAPRRIVAFSTLSAALWDFGYRTVGTWSWAASNPDQVQGALGSMDLSTQQVVSNADGNIDPEKLVAAQPDLVLCITEDPADPADYNYFEPEILERVRNVAPLVALTALERSDLVIGQIEDFLASIGHDLASDEVVVARDTFTAAEERFRGIVADKAAVTSTFLFAGEGDEFYVYNPARWDQLVYVTHLGLNAYPLELEADAYFDTLSWEQALKYPSDVVFNSNLDSAYTLEELSAHETFSLHPAVAAGQVGIWGNEYIRSYQGLTTYLDGLSDTLETAAALGN